MSSLPEFDASWAVAMKRCAEAARQAASQMALLSLMMNEELADWDAEMDNCYPNWPDA